MNGALRVVARLATRRGVRRVGMLLVTEAITFALVLLVVRSRFDDADPQSSGSAALAVIFAVHAIAMGVMFRPVGETFALPGAQVTEPTPRPGSRRPGGGHRGRTRETMIAYFRTMMWTAWTVSGIGLGVAYNLNAVGWLSDMPVPTGRAIALDAIGACLVLICLVATATWILAFRVHRLGYLHLTVHYIYVALISLVCRYAGGVAFWLGPMVYLFAIGNVSVSRGMGGAFPLAIFAASTFLLANVTAIGFAESVAAHWQPLLGQAALVAVLLVAIAWYAANVATIARRHALAVLSDVEHDVWMTAKQLADVLTRISRVLERALHSKSPDGLAPVVEHLAAILARVATDAHAVEPPMRGGSNVDQSFTPGSVWDAHWRSGRLEDLEIEEEGMRLRAVLRRLGGEP